MLSTFISDILASIRFLSRLPVPQQSGSPQPDFARIAWTFPLAGLIIALPGALLFWISMTLGLPAAVSALLATGCMIIVTGALHEDGLADVADGFYGGNETDKRLTIMRDSQIGTYGTLALVLSIGLKTTLLETIATSLNDWRTAVLFICVASLSRTAILYPWSQISAARAAAGHRKDGVGKDESGLSTRYGIPPTKTFYQGAVLSLPVLAVLALTAGWWPMIMGVLLLKLFTLAMTRLSKQKIGGHTGDTLGATQQISEIGLLLGLTIAM